MSLPLHLHDLRVESPRRRTLLAIDRLVVPAGTLLGVRGPSGAGKSTLVHALAGLWERAWGQVRWGDTEVLSLNDRDRTAFRAREVGMIFQDFLLFEELSGPENASLAALFRPREDRKDIADRAARSLKQLGISESARSVASFSGGERQRVAVARALAHDPGILLADEPTASLHREAADRLIDDLASLARAGGKTLIAVSHDTSLLDRMDRVLTIADGRISDDTVTT